MTHETLTKTLVAIGKPPYIVELPGGGRVLLLPHGGRVLGLFGPGDEENYYWTNPALASPESADVYYSGDDWCGTTLGRVAGGPSRLPLAG